MPVYEIGMRVRIRIRSIVLGSGIAAAAVVAAACAGPGASPATRPAPPVASGPAAGAAPAPAVAPAPMPTPAPLTRAERAALKRDGMAAYDRKEWATCARLLEQAGDHYDAACCYAQAGDRDRAFALLDRAIRVDGFLDGAHLAKDTDLTALHGDPRWEATVKTIAAAAAERKARLNAELLQIYDDDQGDRRKPFSEIDWKVVGPRDQARRKRVDEIVAAGGAKVADDYYHAAMVFQHGDTPAEIQHARELALKAVAIDPGHKSARWLAAAAEDRKLMYEKKPQKWGTQFQRPGGKGKWVLYDVDPSTTDEEREAWNVPPLAEARARADRMNQAEPPMPAKAPAPAKPVPAKPK